MKPTRHLSLRRESLAELSSDELSDVAAGTTVTSVYGCHTYEVTCWGCPASFPVDKCPINTA